VRDLEPGTPAFKSEFPLPSTEIGRQLTAFVQLDDRPVAQANCPSAPDDRVISGALDR
jgi:hypothetical protein